MEYQNGPGILMTIDKDFDKEKQRLIDYLSKTQELSEAVFDNKASLLFGPLSIKEWNIMFSKYLDHHLGQYGV